MRTPAVAAVACAVGAVVGVVAAVTVANADDQARDAEPSETRPVACADIITEDVLEALQWSDASARADERVGRCEWFGTPGNITAGTLASPVDEVCDEAGDRQGYEASTSWLADPSVDDGCVMVNEEGVGLYEVVTEVDDEVVQVRLALLEPRPVDAVRAALVELVAATPAAFE